MPIYRYRAKKSPDENIEQIIEAASEKEAVEKVIAMGITPVHIELYVASRDLSAKPGVVLSEKRIKSREITIFSRQLASLLKSGVPILKSINIILEQSENQNFKSVLKSIHNSVKDGSTFSAVLSLYPQIFSPLFIAMVRTGEGTGALPEALIRIADYRTKQEELISRFRMALAYPILMAVVGLATIIFMLTFVIPRLMKLFVGMGQSLPLPTRILISVSNLLSHWWLWVILALFILVARRQAKQESAKIFLSRFSLHIPIFGKLILKAELGRFSRTLELLLRSGIPILRAIDIAIPVVNNQVLREKLKTSYKDLEQGGSFGKSLKDSKLFPLFISNLIIVGEESGKLNDALAEIAYSYERDTDEAMKIVTNLIEPLMILTMGLIVGFIVVAMLLPIFEINLMAR